MPCGPRCLRCMLLILSIPVAEEFLSFLIMSFVWLLVKGNMSGSVGNLFLRLMVFLSFLCGCKWLIFEKWFISMFACCFFEGMVSVVVMAACEGVVLLLESVMLFIVL